MESLSHVALEFLDQYSLCRDRQPSQPQKSKFNFLAQKDNNPANLLSECSDSSDEVQIVLVNLSDP